MLTPPTHTTVPTIKRTWAELAERSNREGRPAERFFGVLLEREMKQRETRRQCEGLPLDRP